MNVKVVWVLVVLLLVGARADAQSGERIILNGINYGVYENERFGFSLLYPADILTPADKLPGGAGRFFLAVDGSVALTAYGAPKGETLLAAFDRELAAADQTVTYEASGPGWFVVSGYKNGVIFYRKTLDLGDALASFRLSYHPSWRPLMDEITTEISHAFVAPAP